MTTATRPPRFPSGLVPGVVARLLEDGPEDAFDRLTRLATMALRAPVSVLSLISNARLLVKSQVGLPEPWASTPQQPLPHAMFRHALATSKAFVVEDVRRHPLTKDMVLGAGWEQAAYCGVPILLAERRVAGVLSVMSLEPRGWTDAEITFLQDLAATAAQEIEGRLEAEAEAEAERAEPDDGLGALGQLTDAVFTLDADWRLVAVNPRAERLLGRTAAELAGESFFNLFPGIVGTVFHQEFVRAMAEQCAVELEDHCNCLHLWLEVRAFPHRDGLAVQLRDVTARRDAEEALRESESRYRAVFQESPDPIFFTAADGSFIECNRAMLDCFGYTREALFRLRLEDLFVEDAELQRFRTMLEEHGAVARSAVVLRRRDGERVPCEVSLSGRHGEDGAVVGWHGVIHVDAGRHGDPAGGAGVLADPLTGLPNRAVFMDRLERTLVQANRRPDARFAVLFVDLDRFKQVNDSLGHMAGDELLVAVGGRLAACLRQEDTIARFGGDEFAILLDSVQDVRDATRIAERINLELALPITLGRREIAASASIGIAYSATGYRSAEQMVHDADAAMYRAKSAGRGRYEVFDTEMHRRAVAQIVLEDELRRAVAENQFHVLYMPIVALEGGTVEGMEALVRWAHPQRGVLAPEEFIGIAERSGLIVDLGWYVLREACGRMREWQHYLNGAAPAFSLNVNLSPRQFLQPDLIARIDGILAETGLSPEYLRLELTEASIMREGGGPRAHVDALRERGIRICLDDFGRGSSSLAVLHRLPIAAIKIDRIFVRGVTQDEESRGLVRAIVALGRSLSIDAVAEGVETVEQLQALRTLGAPLAQGYLFSEPLDADEATELVLDRTRH
jgi:diguanylate cyclase (GGDEF)-like protein/PAS domain S-box-containing protein